jgi:hypothetical protein
MHGSSQPKQHQSQFMQTPKKFFIYKGFFACFLQDWRQIILVMNSYAAEMGRKRMNDHEIR